MSGLSQALLVKTRIHIEHVLGLLPEDVIHFPDFPTPFPVKRADFVRMKHDPRGSEMFSLIEEITEADLNSWGVIVNNFEDMEREHIPALESLYKEAKAWFVGPLLLSVQIDNEEEEDDDGNEDYCPYIDWLDKLEVGLGSVIYVSFGSEAKVSEEQLEEIAFGLKEAAQPFVWVVKSKTWAAPPGWEERVEGRGLVVRGWAEQRRILVNSKIGGFLSHCGWNLLLEGLSMAVALLAWPTRAEQPLNSKIVADWLGAGIKVFEMSNGVEIVGREVICEKVKELMVGEEGRKGRERAVEVKRMAWEAMKKGGSSDTKLNEMIECWAIRRKEAYI